MSEFSSSRPTKSNSVWFVTGASGGLGSVWVRAALERGDSVVAASRRASGLEELRSEFGERLTCIRLDVTDSDAVRAAVADAERRFGGIDVLVNNAGHMLVGAVEEVTEEQARDQLESNFFGALWTTRAVLPGMRQRGAGRILQVSSVGGLLSYPSLGIYQASKWALEAMSESLHAEVQPFGVHVTLIEPIIFPTGLAARSPKISTNADYDRARVALYAASTHDGFTPGRAEATASALMAVVDAEEPPVRVLFGTGGVEAIRRAYDRRISSLAAWEPVSELAQGSGSR